MEKNISDFTTVELKAIAYDLVAQTQQIQQQLRIINDELLKRAKDQNGAIDGNAQLVK